MNNKDNAAQLSEDLYPSFPEFKQYGIDLSRVAAQLILELQEFRITTGIPIIPSPLQNGWWRDSGSETSRHYAVDRLSDAGDIFPAKGRCLELWLRLQPIQNIGAIGIYLDTYLNDMLHFMLHFDLRNDRQKILWVRKNGEYFYFPQDSVKFWGIIGQIADFEKDWR